MSTTMTLRLEDDLKNRLEQLAKLTNRSKSFLASEAIRDFVDQNEWQLKEIRDALDEDRTGQFASTDEVEAVLTRWR